MTKLIFKICFSFQFSRCVPYQVLIKEVVRLVKNYEFERAGEKLNLFEGWELDQASENLVSEILQMSRPNEVLDFVKKGRD